MKKRVTSPVAKSPTIKIERLKDSDFNGLFHLSLPYSKHVQRKKGK